MIVAKTLGLFFVTAVAEIVGCYLPYLWLRKDGSPWLLLPGGGLPRPLRLAPDAPPHRLRPRLCRLWRRLRRRRAPVAVVGRRRGADRLGHRRRRRRPGRHGHHRLGRLADVTRGGRRKAVPPFGEPVREAGGGGVRRAKKSHGSHPTRSNTTCKSPTSRRSSTANPGMGATTTSPAPRAPPAPPAGASPPASAEASACSPSPCP